MTRSALGAGSPARFALLALLSALWGCGDGDAVDHSLGPGTFMFDYMYVSARGAPPVSAPLSNADPPPASLAGTLPGAAQPIQYGVGYMLSSDATVALHVGTCTAGDANGQACPVSIEQFAMVLHTDYGDPVLDGSRLTLDHPVSVNATWQLLALDWEMGGMLGSFTLLGSQGDARTLYRIVSTRGTFSAPPPDLSLDFELERVR